VLLYEDRAAMVSGGERGWGWRGGGGGVSFSIRIANKIVKNNVK